MEEVHPTAGVQRDDWPILLSTLEPRPAGVGPGRAWHELGDVLVVVVNGVIRGRDGLDTLGLALLDDFRDVSGNVLAEGEDTTVSDWGVRTQENWSGLLTNAVNTCLVGKRLTEIVRHPSYSTGHVRLRYIIFPDILEVAMATNQRESRAE